MGHEARKGRLCFRIFSEFLTLHSRKIELIEVGLESL